MPMTISFPRDAPSSERCSELGSVPLYCHDNSPFLSYKRIELIWRDLTKLNILKGSNKRASSNWDHALCIANKMITTKSHACIDWSQFFFRRPAWQNPAQSADAQTQDDWTFTIAPYLWGSSLAGTVATIPGLPPVEVDSSFGDIWDNLDAAGMIVGNARKGRWGVTGDLQYIKLQNATDALAPAFGTATVNATNKVFSLSAEYLLANRESSELWGSAGLRYWSVDTSLNLAAGNNPAASASGKDSWIDPVIGLRGRVDISNPVYLTGWAYVGGFGGGSESMFDLFGAVGYQFTPVTSAVIGYRWMSVDRQNGNFVYDVEMKGLMAGLSFTF